MKEPTIHLSVSDRAILNLLQSDLDLSRNELAARAGVSVTTFWRRVKELEEIGLIRKRVALIDPAKAGLEVCVFVFVNIVNYERRTREWFEGMVARHPWVMECYAVTGSHDYTLIVRCPSVADFEEFLVEEILPDKSVASATSQIALRQHKYETKFEL